MTETNTLLMACIPIEDGDPLGMTSRTTDEISRVYFQATDSLPKLVVSGRGDMKDRSGQKIEVNLNFVVGDDLALAVSRLKMAFTTHSFPPGTRVIKMWRGDDFVLQNDLVFEHPEPNQGEPQR